MAQCWKLQKVLQHNPKTRGGKTTSNECGWFEGYDTFTTGKNVLQWICHLFCLLQWNTATNGSQENPSQIFHCKWICNWIQEIQFSNKDGERVTRKIEDYELTDLLKAMVAPARPYGFVFAYSRGSQKSLQRNYQFLRWIKIILRGGDKPA